MADFITLLGSEDVRSAGASMRQAASEMARAASSIEDSLHRQRLYLDDLFVRLEDLLVNQAQRPECHIETRHGPRWSKKELDNHTPKA